MAKNGKFQDLFDRVSMYLDGELDRDEEVTLLAEIQSNPQYMQVLSKEKHFRDFVKSRLQRRSVSPTLIQSIKDKIHTVS